MPSMNRVYLLGNLTRDPVLRRLNSGTSVADMGLAVSENGDGNGKSDAKKPAPVFVDLVAWSKLAENCGAHLAKGSQVLVEGRLQFDEWTDDKGNKRSKIKVCADRIQFLSRLRSTSESDDAPAHEADMREAAPRAAERR